MISTRNDVPTVALVLGRWARALGAVTTLVAVLLGVPAALLAWGDWPITGLPTARQVRDLPGTVASDSAVIGVFTVAVWVGWALFAVCVAIEAVSEMKGRDPRRVLAAGPLQGLARNLVTTVAVTVGSLGHLAVGASPAMSATPAVSAPARPAGVVVPSREAPSVRHAPPVGGRANHRPVAATADAAARAPGRESSASPAPAPAAAGTATTTHPAAETTVVVEVGDNPWQLAERHLGAGARWTELWAANRGRPQPDGRTWDEPALLLPGWRLTVPSDPGADVVVAGRAGAGQVVVQPDDNPWSLAARHLGEGTRWRELFALNRGRPQPGGGAWVVERHIEPGWVLDLPGATPGTVPVASRTDAPAPQASPEAPAAPVEPQVPDVQVDPVVPDVPDESVVPDVPAEPVVPDEPAGDGVDGVDGEADGDLDDGDLDIVPVAVAGTSALLAAGVVMRLDVARLRRGQRRPRGAPVPAPGPEVEVTERRWRAVADHESAAWVDAALRYLTWAVREAGTAVEVVGVRIGPAGVAFLLGAPAPGGAPRFVPERSGWEWALDCDDIDAIGALAAGEAPYAPGLVTLGTTDDGSTLLVDLERLGLTSIEGDRGVVRAWLTAVALDVATAPWAGEVELCLAGGLTELGALDRVSVLDAEDVHAAVQRAVLATTAALGERPSTQAARADHQAEPWPPVTVVVAAGGPGPSLAEVAEPGKGAGVVAVGPVRGATYRLSAGADGYAMLFPFGLAVRLSAVDPKTAIDTARLLAGASSAAPAAGAGGPVALGAPAVAALGAPVVAATADEVRAKYDALIRSILEPAEVEVTVLGRPAVTGWATEPRQRSVEIVCYLAVHDGPVTGERLRDRIFPPGFKPTSLRQAVSRTRSALGRSTDGRPHILPAAKDGSYELGRGARSDLARFQALVAAARHAPEACEIPLLRTALALVQGPPFSDCPAGGYGWASSEGISYALERMVIDTAHRLNELAFAIGDARLAEWASRQGQRALPGHEGLYCDLALAKLRQDDLDGFAAVRREAEASATALDSLDGLQPETHEFFTRALAQYRDLRDAAGGG